MVTNITCATELRGNSSSRSKCFGEIEFWLAIWKVILAVMMIFYTFFTMDGANPLHWVYGFTYWKNPGPVVDYLGKGGSRKSYFHISWLLNQCVVHYLPLTFVQAS